MNDSLRQTLASIDWVFIIGYFLLVMGIGFYFMRKSRTATGYFLAGRHAGWITVGAALFAANISSEHFVGLAGSGYKSGFAVAQFEVFASVCCLALGWIFVPFYVRAGVFTMPEFLERRFNPQCRHYLSAISLISYVLTKISVTLYAGSLFLEMLFGWTLWKSSLVLVIATGVYTVAGGLAAVMYTELVQAFVLVGGALILTLTGLHQAGGLHAIIDTVPMSHWSMLKPLRDPDFPWLGMFFGVPILGVWYWCTDQYMVQRALGAKNVDHARGGAILTGYFKLLPMFLLVFPGIIALKLFPNITADNSNTIYPRLTALLPVGVKGMVIASLFGAMMSSLGACFNSCGTLFTMDIYKPRRPQATDRELVMVGRLVTIIMVGIGILYVPMMKFLGGSQLYSYLQKVQAYISPPIAAVFLLGLLWKRLNGAGALAALYTGFVLGIGRLILEFGHNASGWSLGAVAPLIEMNFLHFAMLMFVICVGVLILVSMVTPPASDEKLRGLTFATTPKDAHAVDLAEGTKLGRKATIIASLVLAVILVALWAVFYVIIPMRMNGG